MVFFAKEILAEEQLLSLVNSIYVFFGQDTLPRYLLQLSLLALALLLAWFVDWVMKRLFLRWIRGFTQRTETKWDDALAEKHVFERIAHLAPALVLYAFARPIFPQNPTVRVLIQNICVIFMVVMGARALSAFANALVRIFRQTEALRTKPLESYSQIFKIAVWLFAAVLIASEILGRSPWALLGGLGAFTAFLLLAFRDSLLGFVASVQISTLDLVREGDWIEMPRYGADGYVVGFSLTTVRVQNWDKTISTIPTYALTAESFKNWRGMIDSGARRIKRALYLDMTSIRFLDEPLLERLRPIQLLRSYLTSTKAEITAWNQQHEVDLSSMVNGRRLTNIGTFRAYVEAYLRAHESISQEMILLVRQLAPTAQGLPLEIYAFSKEQRWVQYEKLIADIFDHLFAVLPEFDLRVFQQPSGADVKALLKDGGLFLQAPTQTQASTLGQAQDQG